MTTAAAEGWDPDKEAADLSRLRAALSAQLEQVEQKMAALGANNAEQPRPHKSVSNLAKVRAHCRSSQPTNFTPTRGADLRSHPMQPTDNSHTMSHLLLASCRSTDVRSWMAPL